MKDFLLAIVNTVIVIAIVAIGGIYLAHLWTETPSAPRTDPQIVRETRTITAPDTPPRDRAAAYYRRARLYRRSGQTAGAVADYRAAIPLEPPGSAYVTEIRSEIVETYRDAGDFAHAMAEWKIYSADPTRTYSAYLIRADIYRAMHDDTRELADIDAAIRVFPFGPEGHYARSNYLASHRRYDEALHELDIVEKIAPGESGTKSLRLGLYLGKGDFLSAWRVFTAEFAQAMSEVQTDRLATRAGSELDAQNFGPAIADYTGLLARDSHNASYLIGRGEAYLWSGQSDKGLADLKQAVFELPTEPDPHMALAEAYTGLFRFDDAMEEFRLTIVYSEFRSYPQRVRGLSEIAMDRPADAAADFTAVLKEDPRDFYAVVGLHMTRQIVHQDDKMEFASNAARIASRDWPVPLLAYLTGRIDRTRLLAEMRNARDPLERTKRLCIINFYTGFDALVRGDRAWGIPALQAAAKSCPPSFVERTMAQAAMKKANSGAAPTQ